jgi:molybdate transport system substrate-binding protein
MRSLLPGFTAACLVLVLVAGASADEIRVAVASNFTAAMQAIAARFAEHSGHRVVLAFGSTGRHYAQIVNGAPFDAFFAADARRPGLLEQEGLAVPGSRFTYAQGRLVLWSPRAGYVDAQGAVLDNGFRHLAIANPRLAPYGRAAEEVLRALGLWSRLSDRLVRGENVAQAFQFVASGNAELGFVAAAQLKRRGAGMGGSQWEVPEALYSPITQQAVLLADKAAARALLAYVRGPAGRELIEQYGYGVPDPKVSGDAQ